MQKKKRKSRPSFIARMMMPFDGASLVGGGYRVEMYGEGGHQRLLISGADRILSCTEDEVIFTLRSLRLILRGDELACLTYEGGVAEVSGDVSSVLFEKGGVGR